jgi:plastocyanin
VKTYISGFSRRARTARVACGFSLTVVVAALLGVAAAGQSSAGAIRGHIVLTGKSRGNPFIRMGVDPKCSALNAGHRTIQESAMVTADGSVANVFVKLDGTFPNTTVPIEPVVIEQRACVYRPRVIGMRVGQTLQIKNDDNLLHNVHSSSAVGNSFNVGQPTLGVVFSFMPRSGETMLTIGCDVHRWMTAYVGIVSHPYFSISGGDGTFSIAKVPPGTYTIRTWHERFGELAKKITIKPGVTTPIDFAYTSGAG